VTRFLLDTSICVELLRGRASAVLARMRSLEIDEVAISSITMAELQYGVAKSANPAKHEVLLAEFCAPLDILPFDALAAETYGRVQTEIERRGKPIGPLDTLIASHAVSLDVTLVTNNDREFRRVPGLRVENWMARSGRSP
jgi:tRNA(fMet)-specific endonuclease VapC